MIQRIQLNQYLDKIQKNISKSILFMKYELVLCVTYQYRNTTENWINNLSSMLSFLTLTIYGTNYIDPVNWDLKTWNMKGLIRFYFLSYTKQTFHLYFRSITHDNEGLVTCTFHIQSFDKYHSINKLHYVILLKDFCYKYWITPRKNVFNFFSMNK